jgi:ABC-type sugar transport system, periplasmic component
MYKTMILAFGLALAGAGAALADSPWTGGDSLPTNPLACDNTPGTAASIPYDGGQPTGAPDLKGKKITVVDVPKLIGIGYFNATSKGIADAAKELGNVDVKTDGPTKANIDEQITFLDNYITSGVNGILFAANDPVAIAPVLKKALGKGIHVVGYDANSTPMPANGSSTRRSSTASPRPWSTTWPRRSARRLLRHRDLDLHHAEPGKVDLRDGGLSGEMPSQDALDGDGRSPGRQHPLLQPGDDPHQQVWRQSEGHLRHDQRGHAGLGRSRHPIRQMRQDRRVGLATPNAMKPYVAKDCVKSVVLWNPIDLGYAAMYVLRAAVDGDLKPGATSVKAGKLGDLQIINGSEVLLGAPFIFTKDNINNFDF